MSRGPGRVERAISEAFESEPDSEFYVLDLCRLAYPEETENWPDGNPPEKRRRAVLRAATKVARRMDWYHGRRSQLGHEVYFIAKERMKAAAAKMRSLSAETAPSEKATAPATPQASGQPEPKPPNKIERAMAFARELPEEKQDEFFAILRDFGVLGGR